MYLFVWVCANGGQSQHCLSAIAQLSLFLKIVYDYVALSWSGIQYTNQADFDLRD